MKKLSSREDLSRLQKRLKKDWDPDRPRVHVCLGTGCKACGGESVYKGLQGALRKARMEDQVDLVPTGCHGFCERGALVMLEPSDVLYTRVESSDSHDIVDRSLKRGKVVNRLLYDLPSDDGSKGRRITHASDIPFYKHQLRTALELNGHIDPTDIMSYIREGGYAALSRALFELSPEDVIEEVSRSGLRGRGGGGFPTGKKWSFCRQAPGEEKYIICNADEGDPGAFMDRSLLEGNPHAVLEGMAIGAYAIGAQSAYIYIRAEYPLAIERLRIAIDQMTRAGLLGERILGSDFSLGILIKEGAGAFVCGEETALIASIEGKRGMPRPRPPFPAQKGLWGKPSNINNVETWGNVPLILKRGPEWFSKMGTAGSKGTKIFSLVGKVNNTGLVEVPMGMSLRELVEEIGGGVQRGGKLKAVQTGGPSGGCLPARLADLPIEYESLAKAGSIMGSGGLVVMDESTCMVDLARYFLSFTQKESCGECAPCRLGTRRMFDILERICSGGGEPEDIARLESLARSIKDTSLCGLGQTAPNPVLTTLKYFRHEYEEHIYDRHCRAAVCKAMVVAPCHHTCPSGIEAHRYVRLCSIGRFDQAYLVVRERIPFPSICGLVCFHPCETRCKRGQLDEPIAIRMLKGAAVKYGKSAEKTISAKPTKRSGKSVAVVGSGPAGLTAAYYLAKKGGHDVTVFEELPKAGGMLRTGIPRYRLPERDLEHDLDIIRRAGVSIKTRSPVKSVAELKRKGFDAVFLAMGAHASWDMGIRGQGSEGVLDCVQFLRDVTHGKKIKVGDRVAVVGGGNSAVDAARTARRLGAEKVILLYRRTEAEMPADPAEVTDALEEGVQMETLTVPVKISRAKSGLRVTCQRMELSEMDESGRRRPVPVEGSEYVEVFDTLITAIGQYPEIPKGLEVDVGRGSRIVNPTRNSRRTEVEGVFAGGDVVLGPASVIEAIAHGRRAAEEIDLYLGGDGDISEILAEPENLEQYPPMQAETKARLRPPTGHVKPGTRIRSFNQVEKMWSREEAMEEGSRCLRCDLEEA